MTKKSTLIMVPPLAFVCGWIILISHQRSQHGVASARRIRIHHTATDPLIDDLADRYYIHPLPMSPNRQPDFQRTGPESKSEKLVRRYTDLKDSGRLCSQQENQTTNTHKLEVSGLCDNMKNLKLHQTHSCSAYPTCRAPRCC